MQTSKALFAVCLPILIPEVISELVQAEYDSKTGSITYDGMTFTHYHEAGRASPWTPPDNDSYVFHLICTFVCILTAALAAGLTMGLVSLEPFDMKILMEANEDDCTTDEERNELRREKAYARKLHPLVSRHHLLLVTLLLMNSIANEALPLFLHEIVSPVAALTISVTAVLLFGEILPSAIFTGPNQLAIGAAMAPIVWFFIYMFYVVGYPLAILLDALLGEEHKGRYNKAEFKALINLHNDPEDESAHIHHGNHIHSSSDQHLPGTSHDLHPLSHIGKSGLTRQELRIMAGALELRRIRVKDTLLPLDKVFMLSMDTKLNADTLAKIVLEGHSRIPVYEGHPHNVRGMVLVKRLVVLYPDEEREVGSLALLEPHVVGTEDTLLDVLFQFCSGRSHLAIVTSDPKRVLEAIRSNTLIPVNAHMAGIITLEDIIERLIKQDIQDESDISVRSAEKMFQDPKNFLSAPTDGPVGEVVSPLVYASTVGGAGRSVSSIPSPIRPMSDVLVDDPLPPRSPLKLGKSKNPLATPLLGYKSGN